MTLSITSPIADELVIYRRPNYTKAFLWTAGTVFVLWWSLTTTPTYAFAAFIFLIMALIDFFTQQEITCKINKVTEVVEYKRKGMVEAQTGFQALQFSVKDIRRVEMHNYASHWRSTFQICLDVEPIKSLPLTAKDLSFSECQNYAGTISRFLGPEIPVVAVD